MHAAEKRWPYTYLQTPEWEVRKELRPWGRQFRRRKFDGVVCYILRRKTQLVHIQGNISAARYRNEVFSPHILPAMNLRRDVFQHDNTRFEPNRTFVDDLDRRVRSRQPAPQTLQELQQALEQEWGEFCKTVFVDWSNLCRDRSVLCYRIMVGTTNIDFEVMSSERYGLQCDNF